MHCPIIGHLYCISIGTINSFLHLNIAQSNFQKVGIFIYEIFSVHGMLILYKIINFVRTILKIELLGKEYAP